MSPDDAVMPPAPMRREDEQRLAGIALELLEMCDQMLVAAASLARAPDRDDTSAWLRSSLTGTRLLVAAAVDGESRDAHQTGAMWRRHLADLFGLAGSLGHDLDLEDLADGGPVAARAASHATGRILTAGLASDPATLDLRRCAEHACALTDELVMMYIECLRGERDTDAFASTVNELASAVLIGVWALERGGAQARS